MIISHQHQFIFLRIPKTASTSIEIELSKICGPKDVITPLRFQNDPTGKDSGFKGPQNHKLNVFQYKLHDWYRIIVLRKHVKDLRHGTAKQIKDFIGLKTWNSYYKFCVVRNPFDRVISQYYWQYKNKPNKPDINEFILNLQEEKINLWPRYTIQNQIAMNFICRYEKLNADLEKVTTQLGLAPLHLPKAKTTQRKNHLHYSQIINHEARARVELLCADEIKTFDYYWQTNETE